MDRAAFGSVAAAVVVLSLCISADCPQKTASLSRAAERIGPGVVSTLERDESGACFGESANEIFFTRDRDLYRSVRTQSEWSAPQRLSVSTAYLDANPVCTSDGARLYFTSRSPLPAPLGVDQADLWVAERGADGVFGAARRLAAPVNSNDDEERAAAAASGALYFSSNRRGGFGATDLFRAVGGEEQRLPGGVNSPHEDADPFVDPDERYLVFRSDRPGGAGCCDLYISFRHRGVWSAPRNLGPAVNTEGCEASPHVDPSGEHLLFTRGDHAGGRDLWTAPFASLQPEAGTP